MDDGLWGFNKIYHSIAEAAVSILLVMDDGLWGFNIKVLGVKHISLNPSCNG